MSGGRSCGAKQPGLKGTFLADVNPIIGGGEKRVRTEELLALRTNMFSTSIPALSPISIDEPH